MAGVCACGHVAGLRDAGRQLFRAIAPVAAIWRLRESGQPRFSRIVPKSVTARRIGPSFPQRAIDRHQLVLPVCGSIARLRQRFSSIGLIGLGHTGAL
jgi:hypothetical protein